MDHVTDTLETLILMALDANHEHRVLGVSRRDIGAGVVDELHDVGTLLNFDEMRPNSAYTFDMVDSERVFCISAKSLMSHPADILGDESEVVMLHGSTLKWCGYRRLKKAPRGAVCVGRASYWYEMHERAVSSSGAGSYFKRVVALSKDGTPLPVQVQGHWVGAPKQEGRILIVCASVIEDAHRANTMLAEVKDATEIKFPVEVGREFRIPTVTV